MENPRLENWFIDDDDMLCGELFGDTQYRDGAFMCFSRVCVLEGRDNTVMIKNTKYELGKRRDDDERR